MSLRRYPGKTIWHYQCQVNGKKWSRSTGETDKRKAQAKVPELEALAELHRKQPMTSLKLSRAIVEEVDRLEVDVSRHTAERNRFALTNFLKWLGQDLPLEQVDTKILEDFQRHRLRKVSVSTVTRELHAVIVMLRQYGFEVRKPGFKPGKRTEQRDFTDDELRRFFAACEEESHKTFFLLLLCTGARVAEVLPSQKSNHVALLKKEVDLDSGMVTIRTAKLKPGQQRGKVRVIRLPEVLLELLERQMKGNPGFHVFPENGSMRHLFDRIIKRADIPKKDELGRKVTAHSFRHTFATLQASAVSQNPFLLKEILGHCQLSTTERYCHPRQSAAVVDVQGLLGGGVTGWCDPEKNKADSQESTFRNVM